MTSTATNPAGESDKQMRLLDAALKLFEERGYDGVAVPEIAQAAAVAVGTIYRHFATKEALVNALFRHWKSAYAAFVLAPVPEQLAPRRRFAFRFQRIMLFARANRQAMRFLLLHHHRPYLDAQNLERERAEANAMAEFVAACGLRAGITPELGAAILWGAVAGTLKAAQDGRLAFDAPTAADVEESLWRALFA